MNITRTAAKPKNRTITISIPKVNPDSVTEGIWGAADSVALGASKAVELGKSAVDNVAPLAKRGALVLGNGLTNSTPGFGLIMANLNRQLYADGTVESTPLMRLNNAAMAATQVAGLTTAGLGLASAVTGIGSPGPLFGLSGKIFIAGTVLGFANALHTDPTLS
jgi:hypothetical protein